MSDVVNFSGPVLAYLPVPAIALFLLTLLTGMNKAWLPVIVVLGIGLIATWLKLQIWPLVSALRNGLADVGTVVDVAVLPRGGSKGHVKLEHGAGVNPLAFYSLSLHTLRVGDRLSVLVDPATGRVMAAMGPVEKVS